MLVVLSGLLLLQRGIRACPAVRLMLSPVTDVVLIMLEDAKSSCIAVDVSVGTICVRAQSPADPTFGCTPLKRTSSKSCMAVELPVRWTLLRVMSTGSTKIGWYESNQVVGFVELPVLVPWRK